MITDTAVDIFWFEKQTSDAVRKMRFIVNG